MAMQPDSGNDKKQAGDTLLCAVYRCSKKADLYLYIDKQVGTDSLPDALLKQVGGLDHVMDLMLSRERKLARVNAADVLKAINQQGYYLQMPPLEGLM